ncbi:cation:proton antiporter [Prosthecodimorpha staleyi]|uniref:Cation:proton antiporter n=1 Tax=Prosthecodimorpha staleyi TaxID=2840188 RepID=A0A947GEJ1_9HYPH|nr:cation:proton antiporter [Prosthecodimorpha staleyi]MBT9292022.1 cation:proton antiporter [Prosthecodimorpha staleyi]
MHHTTASILLLQATVVLVVPFLFWWVLGLRRFLPLVVVQILTGVLLGPSVLGMAAPDVFAFLFSKDLLGGVNAIATLAVTLFAFKAGTEADHDLVGPAARTIFAVGAGGLIATWAIGAAAGWALAGRFPSMAGGQGAALFAIAFGLCNAVPALPVLAVLLRELDILQVRVGAVALAAAGVGDAILWAGMAVLLPFAAGEGGLLREGAMALGSGLVACLGVRFVAGPLILAMMARRAPERVVMSAVAIVIFAASSLTLLFGLHNVVGAFVAGLFLPERIRQLAADRLDVPTALILMPFFFLATGLKTSFSLADPAIWTIFVVALAVCVLAKLAATMLTARLAGETWAMGAGLGVLLQTKGLMELVIVTVFFERGLVGPATYSALVIVALVSTTLTMPLFDLLERLYGARLLGGRRAGTTVVTRPRA